MDTKNNSPIALVIFGVTGDLASRKLIPAVYELMLANRIDNPMHVIGFARRDWSDEYQAGIFREAIQAANPNGAISSEVVDKLIGQSHYIQGDFGTIDGYNRLKDYLKYIHAQNVLFYLATPPDSYISIIENLGEVQLSNEKSGWRRIIVEKPYGRDLQTAEELETIIHEAFKESQIYRIDHYLGKETVQNILVFRFANGIFEPLWNRRYVDHIQITVAETVGVETRANFYEISWCNPGCIPEPSTSTTYTYSNGSTSCIQAKFC